MADKQVKLVALYNVDSNVIRVQIYITDDCDAFFHPEDVLSGSVQLFNVFNLPETGLQEIPLERVSFNKDYANQDGFFNIFFVNPAVNTNLEARAVLELSGHSSPVTTVTLVINEAGTYTDQPNTSVVGNAINRSWHLDPEKERDEPYLDVSPHNPIALGTNETVAIDQTVVNTVNVDIKFEQLAEQKSAAALDGQLVYLGGGGRLLPRVGVLVYQPLDTPPWEKGASTFAEKGSPQLLPNNTYRALGVNNGSGNIPLGYTMDSPGISIIKSGLLTLQGEGFEALAWELQINGASPPSISPFSVASLGLATPLEFDTSKPIALSLLAGLEKNAAESDITEAKLVFRFFDFADRELPSKTKILDPAALFNARPLRPFGIEAQPSEFPATTMKFTWRLEIASVDRGDFITIRTAVPSVTYTPFSTSQVLTGETRIKDNLGYIPNVPFGLEEGAAVFNLAIGFNVSPTEVKYIFDTRDPSTLDKGSALRVNADGTLTLLIQDATSTSSLTTPPVNWVSGKITEVVAEWSDASPLMRITVDGINLAESSTALPSGLGDLTISSIQLGADAQVQGNLDSEFIRAIFLKRPRSN